MNYGPGILDCPIAVQRSRRPKLLTRWPGTPDRVSGTMMEQTKLNTHLCDCEHRLPFAVLTVWICRFCGELHEIVTNCVCGKCVQLFEIDPF
jgi:hypothetical protein